MGPVGLVGLVGVSGELPSWANSGYFLAIRSDPTVFTNGNIVLDDLKEFDDPQVWSLTV